MTTLIRWAYGVTTVPLRRRDRLPETLASLKRGGFDKPRLFVDGINAICQSAYEQEFGLEVTSRYPTIRIYGNWILGLAELYIREPYADRFAMFQDDFITYRNLRGYLEACPYPKDGYWNLYTFPENQKLAPKDPLNLHSQATGWFLSNQYGKGALALVFSRDVLKTILYHQHMVDRVEDARRGWRCIDGGVVDSARKVGVKEYVHNPSLVRHTGLLSTLKHHYPPDISFRGENLDAMDLLKEVSR